jgi:hypothetical protein
MLTIARHEATALLTAALVVSATGASAAEPELADIAACNEQAAARTSGAAKPGAAPPRQTQRRAPIVEGERDLPRQGAGRETTDPSGSIVTGSDDPLAKGMDAQQAGDPAYRAAYRDCMRARIARDR